MGERTCAALWFKSRREARSGAPAGSRADGIHYPGTEVEPWVEVNPANPRNLIGAWQQDRWSNGGSRGNVVGFSVDGGSTWEVESTTKNTQCTGGTLANGGDYERASDPWVTISPDGTAYR